MANLNKEILCNETSGGHHDFTFSSSFQRTNSGSKLVAEETGSLLYCNEELLTQSNTAKLIKICYRVNYISYRYSFASQQAFGLVCTVYPDIAL